MFGVDLLLFCCLKYGILSKKEWLVGCYILLICLLEYSLGNSLILI